MKSQECFQTSLAQEILLVSGQSKIMTAGDLRLEVINCHLAGLNQNGTCSDSNLEQNSPVYRTVYHIVYIILSTISYSLYGP